MSMMQRRSAFLHFLGVAAAIAMRTLIAYSGGVAEKIASCHFGRTSVATKRLRINSPLSVSTHFSPMGLFPDTRQHSSVLEYR